jgi:hypothetical protein
LTGETGARQEASRAGCKTVNNRRNVSTASWMCMPI